MTWNEMTMEERVEAIRPLWNAGESATLIARRLGCSRNAVIGYVNRYLPNHSQRGRGPATIPNPKKKATPKLRQKPTDHPWQASPKTAPRSIEIASAPELPQRGTVHFIERLSGQCAFPMWPVDAAVGLVCGRPVDGEGRAYCAAHAGLCYRKPETTRLGRHVAALTLKAVA